MILFSDTGLLVMLMSTLIGHCAGRTFHSVVDNR